MAITMKPVAGAAMPTMAIAKAGGGQITIGSAKGWQTMFVYRGKHCPLCRRYLGELNSLLEEFSALGVALEAVSADTREKAEKQVEEDRWHFPVGYGLTTDQMRELGVYISGPRSAEETDRPFAEPALFVVNPEGKMQIIDISNAPASRPALPILLLGLKFIIENSLPIRGIFT